MSKYINQYYIPCENCDKRIYAFNESLDCDESCIMHMCECGATYTINTTVNVTYKKPEAPQDTYVKELTEKLRDILEHLEEKL
jgi:hypothetical protein